jgi:hypothetical protein
MFFSELIFNLYFSDDKRLRKASAWYFVAYKAGTTLSFGWIMNRLMCDIIKQKKIDQEEHQALKCIGKAICNHGLHMIIKNLASSYNIVTEDNRNFSDTEKLGYEFLEIIDQCNESLNAQEFADKFLIFLHKVALNIL